MASTHSTAISRFGASPAVHRSMLLPLLACVGAILALSLFFVWTRQRVLNLEYEIASAESSIRAARQETTLLQLEAATLRQPSRIEQLARDEFGLTMPDPRKMIVVR